jgi:hypothetical protein
MQTVSVDENAAAALNRAADFVAVTDPNGKTVGYFAPVASREELLRRHLFATVDPAKLPSRGAPLGKTYTTAEVKEYLRSLERGQ